MENHQVLSYFESLSVEDYVKTMKEIHDRYPLKNREATNRICNYWKKGEKKNNIPEKAKTNEEQGKFGAMEQERPSNKRLCLSKDITPEASCSGEEQRDHPSSTKVQSYQKSARKSGLIFRGDKVPSNGKLFIDVETVTLKVMWPQKNHRTVAATIAVVNEGGKLILWAFIKRNQSDVCQYSPMLTRLTDCERKLNEGFEIHEVLKLLYILCETNTIVGLNIANDLKSLNFSHPNVYDLNTFYRDLNSHGFKLIQLVDMILKNRFGFQKGCHSSIDNARKKLSLYKKITELEKDPEWEQMRKALLENREYYRGTKWVDVGHRCKCFK